MAQPDFDRLHKDLTLLIKTLRTGAKQSGMGTTSDDRREAAREQAASGPNGDSRDRKNTRQQVIDFNKTLRSSSTVLRRMTNTMMNNANQLHGFAIRNQEDLRRAEALSSEEKLKEIRNIKATYDNGLMTYEAALEKFQELGVNAKLLTTSFEDTETIISKHNEALARSMRLAQRNRTQSAMARARETALGRSMQRTRAAGHRSVSNALASVAARGGAAAAAMGPVGIAVGGFVIALGLAIKAIKAFIKGVVQVAQDSRTSGLVIDPEVYQQAPLLKMMGGELMNYMAQYRRTLEASDTSVSEFASGMVATTQRMYRFGMTIEQGRDFYAKNMSVFGRLAGEAATIGRSGAFTKFQEQQEALFISLKTTIGMTEEAFSSMTNTLAQNEEVQMNLLKLSQRERMAKFMELQRLTATLHVQGMSIEAATEFANKLAAMSGNDTKSRLRQAARLEATMGAAGLGEMGRRVAEEIRKGARGDKDVIAAGLKEFRDATAGMQQSDDLGTQIYGDILNEKSGLAGVMKSVETAIINSGNHVADTIKQAVSQGSNNESQLTSDQGAVGADGLQMLEVAQFVKDNGKAVIAEYAAARLHVSDVSEDFNKSVKAATEQVNGFMGTIMGAVTGSTAQSTDMLTSAATLIAQRTGSYAEAMEAYEVSLRNENEKIAQLERTIAHLTSAQDRLYGKNAEANEMLIERQQRILDASEERAARLEQQVQELIQAISDSTDRQVEVQSEIAKNTKDKPLSHQPSR